MKNIFCDRDEVEINSALDGLQLETGLSSNGTGVTGPATVPGGKILEKFMRERQNRLQRGLLQDQSPQNEQENALQINLAEETEVSHILIRRDGSTLENKTGFGNPPTGVRGGRKKSNWYGRAERMLGVKNAQKPEAGMVAIVWREIDTSFDDPVSTSDKRRQSSKGALELSQLNELSHWRQMTRGVMKEIGTARAQRKIPDDEEEAHRTALDYQQSLKGRVEKAESAFWHEMGIPPENLQDIMGIPNWERITFSAKNCARYTFEEKARRWFWLLLEQQVVQWTLDRTLAGSWKQSLKAIYDEADRLRLTNRIWKLQMSLFKTGQTGGQQDLISCLAGCTAAQIGERYLTPLVARQDPQAAPGERSKQLLSEILSAVVALDPLKLTISDFITLPTRAAGIVRDSYTGSGDNFDRLQPQSQARILSLNHSSEDPLEMLLEKDKLALIDRLPRQQQQAIKLQAFGYTYEEIGEQLGCVPESVKTHLQRGRRRLAELLAQRDAVDNFVEDALVTKE